MNDRIYTILGAGGVVADQLAKRLVSEGRSVRLVSRSGHSVEGASSVEADVTLPDQTMNAVREAEVVFLCVGLKYDIRVWSDIWPRIMSNTIEACKRAGSKLVFFDNVYSYGKVEGVMTESTPYNPSSRKGEVRAAIATRLMDEVKAGSLHAVIARAADFYGPLAEKVGIPNMLVFKRLSEGKKPNLLASDRTRHSYTFTLDIAGALTVLARTENAFDQVWHLPTAADPPTGREFAAMASREFGVTPAYAVLSRWMLKAAGLFDRTIYEIGEMLYQNEFDYIFDSSKFEKTFGIHPAPYADGVRQTAEFYKKPERK